jgi:hypothetical protein
VISCTASSTADVEPAIISGTVIGVEVDPALLRAHVLLSRDGPHGGLARVNVVGSAEGGRDPLVREVTAGISDGVIAPGKMARFVTTGIEVRTGTPQYYATRWLR